MTPSIEHPDTSKAINDTPQTLSSGLGNSDTVPKSANFSSLLIL